MKDFRFPMVADIYVRSTAQSEIGEMVSSWTPAHWDVLCELRSDSFKSDSRYSITSKKEFMEQPFLLYGRFKDDVRRLADDSFVDVTDILVTNIRGDCYGESIFTESFDGVEAPTIFEMRTLSAFANPWGRIEFYKTQLHRSDNQRRNGIWRSM